MIQEETINLFVDNAAKAAVDVHRVRSVDEMNAVLAEILPEKDSIFCPRSTDLEKALALSSDRQIDDYRNAAVCVEEVSAGIAETGSLVCSSHGGTNVQAGLLPDHHVAILASEHIYPDLDDFFASLGDTPPTNVTLETGPSRTADIELTLTVGVHGPGRLSVIVY